MDESAAGRLTVGATALVARVEVVRAAAVRAAAVRAAVVRAAAVRCHEHQLHEGRERAKHERERELLGRVAVAQQRVGAALPDLGSCGAQRRHLGSCERACVTNGEMRDSERAVPFLRSVSRGAPLRSRVLEAASAICATECGWCICCACFCCS